MSEIKDRPSELKKDLQPPAHEDAKNHPSTDKPPSYRESVLESLLAPDVTALKSGRISQAEFEGIARLMKRTNDPYAMLILFHKTVSNREWSENAVRVLAQESTDNRPADWRAENSYGMWREVWFVEYLRKYDDKMKFA